MSVSRDQEAIDGENEPWQSENEDMRSRSETEATMRVSGMARSPVEPAEACSTTSKETTPSSEEDKSPRGRICVNHSRVSTGNEPDSEAQLTPSWVSPESAAAVEPSIRFGDLI